MSFSGIAIAVLAQHPEKGGSGGAVAVAIAFAVLFIRNDVGARAQRLINEKPIEGGDEIERLKSRINAIERRLDYDAAAQPGQNRAITIASVIGTLGWAFGDWAASFGIVKGLIVFGVLVLAAYVIVFVTQRTLGIKKNRKSKGAAARIGGVRG